MLWYYIISYDILCILIQIYIYIYIWYCMILYLYYYDMRSRRVSVKSTGHDTMEWYSIKLFLQIDLCDSVIWWTVWAPQHYMILWAIHVWYYDATICTYYMSDYMVLYDIVAISWATLWSCMILYDIHKEICIWLL